MYRLLITLLFVPYTALAVDCYNLAFNSGDVESVRPRRKIHRTDLGCSSYRCVFNRAHVGSNKLHIYLGRALPNKVSFGTTGGWAEKSIATVRAGTKRAATKRINRSIKARINNAVEIARGVELESLIEKPWLIYGDRDLHDRITVENNCDEKHNGAAIDAFYEIVRIPLKALAEQRHSEGWFNNG